MMYPSFVKIDRNFPYKDSYETGNFKVLLQGYKMEIGFKVKRSHRPIDGLKRRRYKFTRYGWSTGLMRWRCAEFCQKLIYLEDFFKEENEDKIDKLLFKDRRVLIEKTYKWPSDSLPLIAFDR